MYGRNFQKISPFSIGVKNSKNTENRFKTIWIKTANGAYCVVETFAPYDKPDGNTVQEPAYVVLGSRDPTLLAEMVLRGKTPPNGTPPHMIRVISGRYKKDIIPSASMESENPELNFSWVRDAIRKDRDMYQDSLVKHGILTQDGDHIWRSGSSIIWAQPNKDGNFDIYYYGNPKHGKDGLFLPEKAIKRPLSRAILNLFALKINKETIKTENLNDFVGKNFEEFILVQTAGKDPYTKDMPTKFWPKIRLKSKTSSLRTLQKVSNFLSGNWDTVVKSGILTGVFTLGMWVVGQSMVVLGLVGSAAGNVAKSGLGFRTMQSGFTRMTRMVMSQEETKYKGDILEIGPLFCKEEAVDYSGDIVTYPLNPAFYNKLKPVHVDYFRDTYKTIKPYTKFHEREWAKNVLLDTLGCHHGTIFHETTNEHGFTFLEARQPNGLYVDYHPEHSFAYACKRREANSGSPLEKAIQKLFDTAKGKPYVAVKHTGNARKKVVYFENENDFPTDLFVKDPPFDQSYYDNQYEPRPANLLDIVPESKREKIQKKRLPVLKKAFDETEFDINLGDPLKYIAREMTMSPGSSHEIHMPLESASYQSLMLDKTF